VAHIKALPSRPSLEQYKNQAKDLLRSFKHLAQQPKPLDFGLIPLFREHIPRFRKLTDADTLQSRVLLTDAQLVLARQHGFESWPKFAKRIEELQRANSGPVDPVSAFLIAASVPVGDWHVSGTLEVAQAMLAEHPEVAGADIYTAGVLGDDAGVRRFLAEDAKLATAKGGPYGWDALCYLCFSRYLRLDKARTAGFVRAAEALLDAGADVNTGWWDETGQPSSHWESSMYGVAGLAQNPEMTRLLLERGADPNDGETAYHVSETYDNTVMKILVESGKLKEQGITTLLVRKADWHDCEGQKYLLDHGADPNRATQWENTPLHHALRRDNGIENIDLLLDYGGNPGLVSGRDDHSGTAIAARRGRGDVLASMERRGMPIALEGVDTLIASCARNDEAAIHEIVENEPHLVRELKSEGGQLLAEFAGNGNTEGVRRLLDLGVDAGALFKEGDGYFEVAKNSTALHVAAWRARHATVKLLIERGCPVDAADARGRTPLALAVRACVDSYWKRLRTPESVRTLLEAGASTKGIVYPSGYVEVDALLDRYRKLQGFGATP
jgi:ankyrin repeat protein